MVYSIRKKNSDIVYYLCKGRQYTVGRKESDINLDCVSLSRKHATLKVEDDFLVVFDRNSKHGTFSNSRKLAANTPIRLSEEHKIRFGIYEMEFSVKKEPLVAIGSGLTQAQNAELATIIEELDGKVAKHWDRHCTHLTVQQLNLTAKVLNALIDEKPMVNMEYWRTYLNNVKNLKPPPNIEDFKPSIAEKLVKSDTFQTNSKRRDLFAGKTFVFPNNKLKKNIGDIIEKTGGTCIAWERRRLTERQVANSKGYIFIHDEHIDTYPDELKNIFKYLSSVGQRSIPFSEIATAILNCSCEKDCNPHFDKIKAVLLKSEGEPQEREEDVLAFDTEQFESQVEVKTEDDEDAVIQQTPTFTSPPSPIINLNPFILNKQFKRPFNADGEENASKKQKTNAKNDSIEQEINEADVASTSTASFVREHNETDRNSIEKNASDNTFKSPELRPNPFILTKQSKRPIEPDDEEIGSKKRSKSNDCPAENVFLPSTSAGVTIETVVLETPIKKKATLPVQQVKNPFAFCTRPKQSTPKKAEKKSVVPPPRPRLTNASVNSTQILNLSESSPNISTEQISEELALLELSRSRLPSTIPMRPDRRQPRLVNVNGKLVGDYKCFVKQKFNTTSRTNLSLSRVS